MSVEAKLSRLSLELKNAQTATGTLPESNGITDETPESWDDAADDDDAVVEAPGPSLKQITSLDSPAPPPPTPSSPLTTDGINRKWEASIASPSSRPSPRIPGNSFDGSEKRPEKTTSTANRLIAGALGLKAPKKTEEQKQYDRAAKEAEIKRRKKEKEQQEKERLEEENAKSAMWEN